jgi:hypothetical protein
MLITGEWLSAIVTSILGLGSLIGIYVKFSMDIAIMKTRCEYLEEQTEKLTDGHERHAEGLQEWGEKLTVQIHGLRILIEQKIKPTDKTNG